MLTTNRAISNWGQVLATRSSRYGCGLLAQPQATEAEIRALLGRVPDMNKILDQATDAERQTLYTATDLRLGFDVAAQAVEVALDGAALAWGLEECPRGNLNFEKWGSEGSPSGP